MPVSQNSYEFITQKINSMKTSNPSLRNKPNEYVFSALCVKANFFKNPALVLNDSDYEDFIVDSRYDGGVDVLLNDPNSENSDLIIGQSKFYKNITFDDVQNAILKMVLFYKEMQNGHYEQVNENVQRRFISLNSELGEESKIHFVFYTSAPLSGIRRDRLQRKFIDQFSGVSNVELSLLFGSDIEEEIKESESRRPTVENGKITIDEADNCLWYGDDAAIVNVSAFSIKQLYAQHNTNLLARNLRYHITGRDIDNAIRDTIKDDPDSFWLKNNGITIICDDFRISGKEVHLHNFSNIARAEAYIKHFEAQKSEHTVTEDDIRKLINELKEYMSDPKSLVTTKFILSQYIERIDVSNETILVTLKVTMPPTDGGIPFCSVIVHTDTIRRRKLVNSTAVDNYAFMD